VTAWWLQGGGGARVLAAAHEARGMARASGEELRGCDSGL
jgi:hypothetical protein